MKIFKHIIAGTKHGFKGVDKLNISRATGFSSLHTPADPSVEVHSPEHEVVIALGSNVGNRLHNFNEALSLMKKWGIRIIRHGCLYETEPAYVTDQPLFLNSAVRAITKLGPHELLRVLKQIEKDLGRTDGIRYGPRPMDLDILFYGKFKINSETLCVPHECIWERSFVMAPLVDLLGSTIDNDTAASWHSFTEQNGGIFGLWEKLGGESLVRREGLRRVLPVSGRLVDWSQKTHVMGVLNLTPDSFSDGGKFQLVEAAVSQVKLLISEGVDIIDIGAQSTRPAASRISPEEELNRLVPILEAVLQIPGIEGKLLSVDTFYSEVAKEAVSKGAHIVNDISGGHLDPDMLKTVAGLGVPYVAMHMRGDPSTMQNTENLIYEDVCKRVASELYERVRDAELSGVPAWRIIIDPGIGFSKKTEHNLEILMGLPAIRRELASKSFAASHAPMLIGPSRKGFLGEICDRPDALERDPATVAAVAAGILAGANIIRVHNVKDNLDAARVCDALLKQRKTH
ncbi:folate synthesis bifunctional protein, mitochondrial-like [Magnolia sinica]|uniref:folate synthesis bifunctional protein, mitochondrial-like n=1 Tax=Magnolia sinica TaxID=86752 RepID=UPI002659E14D|nr:folate synthesis bifunctional protein, mitochondrial-like [Magnolia sinica]XP_058070497.1 folate synthesis bifunctional protein, mitochondrial-like [Magnolia sinica]XP_058070498.1 folate synthesis bifunctional protein, mitochondrial-like [Magnolia sinica]XP_058070499.1 folate synthesis bifunctional protein, mitochondrial-like [Magnolia sinica]XP_058070500.1 folate synthesis bifunctional protein, mitochondrial-like [Magnolia sinica]